MSMVRLDNGDLVRAGMPVFVRVRGRDGQTVARAVNEGLRHVRAQATLGVFQQQVVISELEADGNYGGAILGTTWRVAGAEYTVSELKHAMARAIPSGAATVAITVFQVDADARTTALDALDPRINGAVVAAGGRAVDAVSQTAGAALDVVSATSDAARGVADFAGGVGEGARGVGGFVGGVPALAFALAAAAVAFALYVKVK